MAWAGLLRNLRRASENNSAKSLSRLAGGPSTADSDAPRPSATRNWKLFAAEPKPLRELVALRFCSNSDTAQIRLSQLGLSVRSLNCLSKRDIVMVHELLELSPARLMNIRNFGLTSLADVVERLEANAIPAPRRQLSEVIPCSEEGGREDQGFEPPPTYSLAHELGYGADWLHHAGHIPIEALGLSVWAYNCVHNIGVRTVADLARLAPSQLMSIRHFGVGCLAEIRRGLQALGLGFAAHPPEPVNPAPMANLAEELGLAAEWLKAAEGVSIADLGLRKRSCDGLCRVGVRSPAEIAKMSRAELQYMRGIGPVGVEQIIDCLNSLGFPSGAGPEDAAGVLDWSSPQSLFSSYAATLRLRPGEAAVISRRLCLDGSKPCSQRQLAAQMRVTGARVSQLEIRARRKLASAKCSIALAALWEAIDGRLAACNGCAGAVCLCAALRTRFGWVDLTPNAVMALASLKPDSAVDRKLRIVRDAAISGQACTRCLEKATALLAERGGELHVLDFAKHALEWSGNGQSSLDGLEQEMADHFARLSDDVIVARNRVYLKSRWEIARGRALRKVVRMVLERLGKPTHFREIAARVRETNGHFAKYADERVHGCLTNRAEFVNAGRGVYGLKDWELPAYKTHAQAIIEMLEDSGRPLSWAVVSAELVREGFSAYNLNAALDQHPQIVRIGAGLIDLKQRVEREEVAASADDLIIITEDGDPAEAPSQANSNLSSTDGVVLDGGPESFEDASQLLDRLRDLVCRRMQTSYKPVLFLSLLECVDRQGAVAMRNLVPAFAGFYVARQTAGLQVEQGGCAIIAAIADGVRYEAVRNVLRQSPLQAFVASGMFTTSDATIRFEETLLAGMDDVAMDAFAEEARAAVREYYVRLERTG